MNIETQIRRALLSIVALAGFGVVAAVQGHAIEPSALEVAHGVEVACDSPSVETVPVDVEMPVVVRADWRASLPATIARSRS